MELDQVCVCTNRLWSPSQQGNENKQNENEIILCNIEKCYINKKIIMYTDYYKQIMKRAKTGHLIEIFTYPLWRESSTH